MVIKKVKSSDLKNLDTCQRIKETAQNLFALKGFEGVSIREIARIACVNVAAINYHFKSKENLREEISNELICDFQQRISSLKEQSSLSEFAVKLFEAISEDSAKCVNQFKIFLESDTAAFDKDPFPVGYQEFSSHMNKDLNRSVPQEERLWLMHVTMSYVVHSALMASTKIGKRKAKKFFSEGNSDFSSYIKKTVEALVKDLNSRYPGK